MDAEQYCPICSAADVADLAELLHETGLHHGDFEKTHAEHDWWHWYAPYLSSRLKGSSPEQSTAAADHYADVRHIPRL